jgi:hypothetical protein
MPEIPPDQIAADEKLCAEATPAPWMNDAMSLAIEAGPMKICDIRGWGYLTGKGHGALGLPEDKAIAIQTANAELIKRARTALPQYIARVKELEAQRAPGSGELEGQKQLNVTMFKALDWYREIWKNPTDFALDYLRKDGGKVASDALDLYEVHINNLAEMVSLQDQVKELYETNQALRTALSGGWIEPCKVALCVLAQIESMKERFHPNLQKDIQIATDGLRSIILPPPTDGEKA